VNGGSGFEPPVQARLRRTAQAFPQPEAVQRLRAEGVRTVVLDRALAAGTPWAALAQSPAGLPGPTGPTAQTGQTGQTGATSQTVGTRATGSGVQIRYQGSAVIYTLSSP
jgi:hypothetical protein